MTAATDHAMLTTSGTPSEHDASATMTFRGVSVTLTLRSAERAAETGTDPETVLVFVDQEEPGPLAVRVNDDDTWEGHTGGAVFEPSPAQVLESIRASIRDESVSYGELAELASLSAHIRADDVELREAAGLPEHP